MKVRKRRKRRKRKRKKNEKEKKKKRLQREEYLPTRFKKNDFCKKKLQVIVKQLRPNKNRFRAPETRRKKLKK